jgi:hypothetical protein
MAALTDKDKAMLDFAALWWKNPGALEAEVRDRFDCSPTRYWQRVHYLAGTPEAALYAPSTVNRLRRTVARRAWARSPRRLAS